MFVFQQNNDIFLGCFSYELIVERFFFIYQCFSSAKLMNALCLLKLNMPVRLCICQSKWNSFLVLFSKQFVNKLIVLLKLMKILSIDWSTFEATFSIKRNFLKYKAECEWNFTSLLLNQRHWVGCDIQHF